MCLLRPDDGGLKFHLRIYCLPPISLDFTLAIQNCIDHAFQKYNCLCSCGWNLISYQEMYN